MENASYALYISIGVLVAIAVISLILFRWRQISILEGAKDDTVTVKNMAEFNAEFEAYDKGLMYGTDVLSCLNKAQNNNQKYVYNNYYGTDTENIGKDDRVEYFINVRVKLKTSLCDTFKAYYKDSTGKSQRVVGLGSDVDTKNNYGKQLFNVDSSPHFDDPTVYYYYFKNGILYREDTTYTTAMWPGGTNKTLYEIINNKGIIETNITPKPESRQEGYYELLTDEDTSTSGSRDDTAKLASLITTVSLKDQIITKPLDPSAYDKTDWYSCVWTTAASDFKSRKFKCVDVGYDENTGYVNTISFEEI